MQLPDHLFKPLVSIVIPVFRGEDFLAEAIDSALAQTYPYFEIIVINDGSPDDGATERVALSYGDKIRYYSKSNGGVATALNMAITQMRGDYFSWLSHDDLYTPTKLFEQVAYLATLEVQERAKTVLYSNYSLFTTDVKKAVPVVAKAVPPEDFRYAITVASEVHGCTLLIPKTAFTDVSMFDTTLRTTQDYDLWFRMAESYRFHHMDRYFVLARSHANQGTIAMSDIAKRECNVLLTKFVCALSVDEVIRATGQPAAIGYAQIAQRMWYRGFVGAAKKATQLAFLSSSATSLRTALRAGKAALHGVALYGISSYVRPYVPAYMRQRIRQLLRRRYNTGMVWKLLPDFMRAKIRPQTMGAVPPHPDTLEGLSLKEKFSRVYTDNIFRGEKSRSGEGSDLVQTEVIRKEIPELLQRLNIKRFIDAPCGDWFWMRHVALPVDSYIGLDIVEALIKKNQRQFGNEQIAFETANLAETPLPKADIIFSRDCLVHLGYADALKILANFKLSGAEYLLTTTFTARTENVDLENGFWRPLNMQLAPFNFPDPISLINEGCTEGNSEFTDKCLGLWRLADIP